MKDFQVGFLNLFNLGASHSGLGCDLRIKNSVFGTKPIIPYQFYKEMEVVFFLSFITARHLPPSRVFDPSSLLCKQLFRTTCQPYKTCHRTA